VAVLRGSIADSGAQSSRIVRDGWGRTPSKAPA
jgi:hypothetical protein